MKRSLKEIYEKLQKKYNLPKFEDLDKEFEIWDINSRNPYILREILRSIGEKIEYFIRIIERSLFPSEAYLSDLYESLALSKKDVNSIFDIYRKLIYYHRKIILAEIVCDEKYDAKIINEIWKEWQNIKEELKKLINKKIEYWKSKPKFRDLKEYMG